MAQRQRLTQRLILIAVLAFIPLVIGVSVYTALHRPGPLPASDEGLIAYWAFHSNLGERARDSVGGHNGTIHNPNWVTGRGYLALKFDGQTTYIEVLHVQELALEGPFTIAAWVNPKSRQRQVLLQKTDPSGDIRVAPVMFYVPWGEGRLGLVLSDGQRRVGFLSDRSISGSRWHHVAVTFDFDDQAGTGQIRFYIDGEPAGERVTTVRPRPTSGPLLIGAARAGSSEKFHLQGELDSLSLYNQALTPEEVLTLIQGQ